MAPLPPFWKLSLDLLHPPPDEQRVRDATEGAAATSSQSPRGWLITTIQEPSQTTYTFKIFALSYYITKEWRGKEKKNEMSHLVDGSL